MQGTRGWRVVLTGGIGAGKSTVAALLAERGAALFDADAASRQLTAPGGSALPAIRAHFGGSVFDEQGDLDRARLRERVFQDPLAKQQLEAIVHPLVAAQAQRADDAAGMRPLVFDIPLVGPDSAWRRSAHRVLVVDCDESTQVRRVMARSGLAEAEVRRIIAQQIPRGQRRALADAVIHNDGLTLAQLTEQIDVLWRHWRLDG